MGQRGATTEKTGEVGVVVGFEPANPSTLQVYVPTRRRIVSRSSNYVPINAYEEIRQHFNQYLSSSNHNLTSSNHNIMASFYAPSDLQDPEEIIAQLESQAPMMDPGNMTLDQAKSQLPYDMIHDAAKAEIEGLISRKVFKFLSINQLPKNSNIIPSKLFFKMKFNAKGNFTKLKARLVAGGHKQKNTSFTSTSFGMIETPTVFLMASLASLHNHSLATLDVPQAYLHAPLEQDHDPIVLMFSKKLAILICSIFPSYKKFLLPSGELRALLWFEASRVQLVEPCSRLYRY